MSTYMSYKYYFFEFVFDLFVIGPARFYSANLLLNNGVFWCGSKLRHRHLSFYQRGDLSLRKSSCSRSVKIKTFISIELHFSAQIIATLLKCALWKHFSCLRVVTSNLSLHDQITCSSRKMQRFEEIYLIFPVRFVNMESGENTTRVSFFHILSKKCYYCGYF